MKKFDIVNALARKYGLRRYLEICTPTTGTAFAAVDRSLFSACDRLMYRCPADFQDGLPVTFRTAHRDAALMYRSLAPVLQGARYDIVLVDGFHTYSCAAVDLLGAWHLLIDDGIVVVHDCDPQDIALAAPEWQPGPWCGVAYAAFIDFVLSRGGIGYVTVATDHGCGVVYKDRARSPYPAPAQDRRDLELDWRAAGDPAERFALYQARRKELLNLVAPADFIALEGLDAAPGAA